MEFAACGSGECRQLCEAPPQIWMPLYLNMFAKCKVRGEREEGKEGRREEGRKGGRKKKKMNGRMDGTVRVNGGRWDGGGF